MVIGTRRAHLEECRQISQQLVSRTHRCSAAKRRGKFEVALGSFKDGRTHVSISLAILLLDSFFPRDSFAKGKPNHATQGSSPTSDPSCHPSVSVRPCELSHRRRELQLSLFSTQRFIAHAFKLKHGELSTQSVHWLKNK